MFGRAVAGSSHVAAAMLLLAAKAMLVQPLQAPELLEGHPATTQSDIYAFGLIMSELLIWQLPFAEEQQAGFSPFRVRCRAAGGTRLVVCCSRVARPSCGAAALLAALLSYCLLHCFSSLPTHPPLPLCRPPAVLQIASLIRSGARPVVPPPGCLPGPHHLDEDSLQAYCALMRWVVRLLYNMQPAVCRLVLCCAPPCNSVCPAAAAQSLHPTRRECWANDPMDRPGLDNVILRLQGLLSGLVG